MSDLREKIAYLQGLAAGLDLDKSTKEGKMFSAIIDVLEGIVEEFEGLSEVQDELEEYIEAIDEDMGDLETEIYGEDDYPSDDNEVEYEELDDDDDEGNYVEVECPQCHDIVRFETSILSDEDVIEVTCPNCDHVVYINEDELQMEQDKE